MRHRLLLPAVTTAAMLAILLGLGAWQLHRLAWKSAILASIAQAEAAPPVPLAKEPAPFTKVEAAGRFKPSLTGLYGAEVRDTAQGPRLGGQLLAVLDRDGGQPPVLVDLGWVPDGTVPSLTPDAARVTGYVREPAHPGWLAPTDDPAARRFYTLDPASIGATLGEPDLAPFTLIALGPAGLVPEPAQTLPRPPNDHLSYAITWFGLAAVLAIVFVAYARKGPAA